MTIYQNTIAGSGFLQGPTGATGPAANTNITVYEYVATAGQTTFTGVDANLNTLAYTPTGIFVTLNGSVLNNILDYTATNGTDIVLTQAANVDDELNIYVFPAFNVANTYTQSETNSLLNTKLNVTGGTITGNVIMSANGYFQVPIGTTAQRPDTTTPGFIRYNTDLNSLESANGTAWANVGSGASSSGGGGVAWTPTVQNTGFIAVKNSGYLVNTATGNVTVTLPASPTIGDNITFVDYGGAFSSNGLIFYPNGNKINANTINVALTTSTASIGLVYTDNNKGWVAYNGFQSSPIGNYSVEYLIVAGGGGGSAGYSSGAGGAGGLLTGTTPILSGTSYSITVGSGGTGVGGSASGQPWPNTKGGNGTNSSFASLTSIGGGGGAGNASGAGLAGGSGGGGASSGSGGSGTAGQGNPGGPAAAGSISHGGGGGGGAGATGANGTSSVGGDGGVGIQVSINGTSTYYAGGGGGGTYYYAPNGGNGPPGAGGSGGGGPGGKYSGGTQPGTSGTTNTGGGGGGGAGFDSPTQSWSGGSGGSGVVILRYLGPQRASGGSISQNGGYTIHTFTGSGTFVA